MSSTQDPAKSGEVRSRQDRPTGSTHYHYGGIDYAKETTEEIGDATWGEVASACCHHDAEGWLKIFVGACGTMFFLYFFLFSLELLGNSAKT